MKKYLALVIAALAMGAATVWADSEVQSEVVDGVTWYYWTSQQWNSQTQQYETYAYVTSGSIKYAGDLTVPSLLGCYAVKMIDSSAFSGCSALTSVTIPEGVTSIGGLAFYRCIGLTSVVIPSSVTSIDEEAFYRCSGLKNVLFKGAPPTGVSDSGLLRYGNVSFPRSLGAAWLKVLNGVNQFRGYDGYRPIGLVLSSKIRENDRMAFTITTGKWRRRILRFITIRRPAIITHEHTIRMQDSMSMCGIKTRRRLCWRKWATRFFLARC